ncbi:MAG: hypothetical protein ACJ8AK_01915 [Gemmatimonadaceae bacterium]
MSDRHLDPDEVRGAGLSDPFSEVWHPLIPAVAEQFMAVRAQPLAPFISAVPDRAPRFCYKVGVRFIPTFVDALFNDLVEVREGEISVEVEVVPTLGTRLAL